MSVTAKRLGPRGTLAMVLASTAACSWISSVVSGMVADSEAIATATTAQNTANAYFIGR